ncbi:MAG: sigma 54-interacting transcriptional regulator [Myxococcota bacterium]|nr:sigma 54-interacting transcriptional regulator [Myxococcota bacterium]
MRRLYLCFRDSSRPDDNREAEAVRETIRELHAALEPVCPAIIKVPWKTSASPTDHAAIRPFAEKALQRARDENPDALIAIHLSPGTPAMHAVWLVLGTTGFVAGPIELFQTADERGRKAGQPPVQRVQFDLDTWLRRYRAVRPQKVSAEDDGQVWDPTRVKSRALREALSRLQEWAPLRVPVLLVGERGTGKTTLANFLRAMSPFQKKDAGGWPTVVCGQFRVNPQLARSELFGHVRGAFTGANRDRQGLLEQADGDTLFLDEIADIDRDTQRLLMAAIEGRGFQRLGETKLRQSSFRLVCATNKTLDELRHGLLDPDFYDRIAVFVLAVPPLRDCQEDLPDAWRSVLTRAIRIAGIKPDNWEKFLDHPKLLAAITTHPLPGNFRDLQRAAYHLLAALQAGRSEDSVWRPPQGHLAPASSARDLSLLPTTSWTSCRWTAACADTSGSTRPSGCVQR